MSSGSKYITELSATKILQFVSLLRAIQSVIAVGIKSEIKGGNKTRLSPSIRRIKLIFGHMHRNFKRSTLNALLSGHAAYD